MKAVYIPALLAAAMLSLSLWVGARIDRQAQEWTALLRQADTAALLGHWELAGEQLLLVQKQWDRQQRFLRTVTAHDDLESAEAGLAGAAAACRLRDRAEFHILLSQLTSQLTALADAQRFCPENIL